MREVLNCYTMVCPHVREIIHSLEHTDYLLVKVGKPWYNYYLGRSLPSMSMETNKKLYKLPSLSKRGGVPTHQGPVVQSIVSLTS